MYLGDSTYLHGSATDPDNDPIVGWEWEVISAPPGSTYSLADANTPDALFSTDTLGGYGITLTVWDGLAWSDPDAAVVWVVENQPPVAVATAEPLSGPAPLTVDFDGTASSDPEGGELLYDWDFGDSSSGTGATTTHEYLSPGSYLVVLMVTDDRWQIDFDTIEITVTVPGVNTPPIADAGEDRDTLVDETIWLTGTATDPDGDPIVSWSWTIEQEPVPGEGALLDPDLPTVGFRGSVAGDYVLALVVSDGMDDSVPDYVTVHVSDNMPPMAVALADVTSGPAPLTVVFDGTQSSDPEGRPLFFNWNFGDASPEVSEPIATHTYDFPGTYEAVLAVQDDIGQIDEDSITITVTAPNNPPEASPTATPNSGPAPLTVQFAANAEDPDGDDLTYLWDFGDPGSPDNTSTLENPTHTYDTPGTYVAWLTVSDGVHDVSASLTIVVESPIELSVARAKVVFRHPTSSRGRVKMVADFNAPMPSASDQVAVYFDGIRLFDVPFSHFRQCLLNPDAYKYVRPRTFVRINFSTMRIIVMRRCLNLSALDNANGVDVELLMGDATATENIMMEQVTCRRLCYIRSD